MESTTLLVLSYLFKVFVFTKPSLPADEVAVLDIVGEELKADTEYYILLVLRGGGGGLTMISIGFQLKHLLPLTITPTATGKNGVIHVSNDLNIKFSAESKVKKIQNPVTSKVQSFVTTGGVEGNPGFDMVTWFKIEKPDGDYKLVFCIKEIIEPKSNTQLLP